MSISWEHDTHRRLLENIFDASTVFGTTQYDPAAAVRPLQVLVGRMIRARISRARRIQVIRGIEGCQFLYHQLLPVGDRSGDARPTRAEHRLFAAISNNATDQNPANPSGELYGIATLVTSSSEPSGLVA